MPSSARLRAVDVRQLFLLAGECRELGDDAATWSTHYITGLSRLIRAEFGSGGEGSDVLSGRPPTVFGTVDWGWQNGLDRAGFVRLLTEFKIDPRRSDLWDRYFAQLAGADGVSLTRTDLMADREWYPSPAYQMVNRTMGVDHYLICLRANRAGHFGLNFGRAVGGRDFTPRERTLVREAHDLVAPLAGGPLASFAEPAPTALPVRARLVLKCLLEGDSDKQAAARLGISRFTVNHYGKQIHRHFGVQTRAELLGRWVKRQWGAKSAWADGPPGR